MKNRDFQKILLSWYSKNKRQLPWRQTIDPYRIWLSEIILQQTRISQGLPYYEKFIAAYKNVHDLAAATEQDILRLWQGLGYYSRARNMLECAKIIVERHKGKFPSGERELLNLPGIGPYTAAAIGSIAFDLPLPVVDGNVYRVLARIFGIRQNIRTGTAIKTFRKLAGELMSTENPGDFNQALMEFGALCCTPVNPGCSQCPFSLHCFAVNNGIQAELPVISPKGKGRERYFHYFVLQFGDSLFLKKRKKKDIWLGLYDFPLVESGFDQINSSKNRLAGYLSDKHVLLNTRTYRHLLTHQVINATFYHWKLGYRDDRLLKLLPEEGKFCTPEEADKLPKPGLIAKYLKEE